MCAYSVPKPSTTSSSVHQGAAVAMAEPEKSELEKQMEMLMAGALDVGEGAQKAKKTAARARRKSRDIEDMFDNMSKGTWEGLLSLTEDKSDEGLENLFKEIGARALALVPANATHKWQEALPDSHLPARFTMCNALHLCADDNGNGVIDAKELIAVRGASSIRPLRQKRALASFLPAPRLCCL